MKLSPTDPGQASLLLDAALAARGLGARGWLDGAGLAAACAGLPAALRARYGLGEARGLAAVALAYGEGPDEAALRRGGKPLPWAGAEAEPLARLARFARADWYGELAARLHAAAAETRLALAARGMDPGPARRWRWLANSGLPERPLALAAGLGSLGRNGLLLVRERGPGTVLGLLLLPFAPEQAGKGGTPEDLRPGGRCGSCRACVEACPTGALGREGSFARERCLQHWSTRPGPLPPAVEAAWGGRLYGCDSCLESCPRFRSDPAARTERGLLGPGVPARWLLAAGLPEIREAFRESVLGQGWMDPALWRRNAGLALRGADSFDSRPSSP